MMSALKVWPSPPFKRLHMEDSLHMAIQTSVLLDTLAALGAKVRGPPTSLSALPSAEDAEFHAGKKRRRVDKRPSHKDRAKALSM